MQIDRQAVLQTFLAESQENLAATESALVVLESHPDDAASLHAVFRTAHTLKGDAASLGFATLSTLAHRLEDVLDRLRSRTLILDRDLTTLMLSAVDALRTIVPRAVSSEDDSLSPSQRALLDRLAELGAASGPAFPASVASISTGVTPSAASRRAHTLRVGIEKLDRMLDLMGEIAIARDRLGGVIEGLGARAPAALADSHADTSALLLDLQELIMKVRMVPVGPTFHQYARAVRDVATEQGKLAQLVVLGEDVELDTTVIEHIRAPLTHMVRNAVDHGIEMPDERALAGKDPMGRVTLRASREAGSIVIQVIDDGGGFDRQRILERAQALGAVDQPEALSDRDLLRLALEPGFSTAEGVTHVSGRGMGMDVVRCNVEALRGSVAIESRPGEGTTVTLRLPLTLAIIEGFAVGVGDATYILPLGSVLECMDLPEQVRRHDDGRGVFELRGRPLPFLRLRDHLGLGGQDPARESVVIVHHEGSPIGIAVDRLLGSRQTVIKSLGPMFRGASGFSGCTLLGSGDVALILDLPALLRDLGAARPTSTTRGGLEVTCSV